MSYNISLGDLAWLGKRASPSIELAVFRSCSGLSAGTGMDIYCPAHSFLEKIREKQSLTHKFFNNYVEMSSTNRYDGLLENDTRGPSDWLSTAHTGRMHVTEQHTDESTPPCLVSQIITNLVNSRRTLQRK